METLDPALAHHGVKGMKWGVRRRGQAAVETASSSGHASPSAHVSEDHKAAVVAKTKHPSHLSNKEMQDLITRMNLEQQYTRLLTTPPPAIPRAPLTRKKKALNFVTNLLADIGKEQVTRVAKANAAIKVEEILAKQGQHKLVDRLTNNGGKKKKNQNP